MPHSHPPLSNRRRPQKLARVHMFLTSIDRFFGTRHGRFVDAGAQKARQCVEQAGPGPCTPATSRRGRQETPPLYSWEMHSRKSVDAWVQKARRCMGRRGPRHARPRIPTARGRNLRRCIAGPCIPANPRMHGRRKRGGACPRPCRGAENAAVCGRRRAPPRPIPIWNLLHAFCESLHPEKRQRAGNIVISPIPRRPPSLRTARQARDAATPCGGEFIHMQNRE